MKAFIKKFFRDELNLNDKRRHRMVKIAWFLFLIPVIFSSFIAGDPNYNGGEIVYKGTVMSRIKDNGLYSPYDLIKENEYYFTDRGNNYHTIGSKDFNFYYSEDKKVLEDFNRGLIKNPRGVAIYCSTAWNTEYINDIKEIFPFEGMFRYNPINEAHYPVKTISDLVKYNSHNCLYVPKNDDGTRNIVINQPYEFSDNGGYYYEIHETSFVFETIKALGVCIGLSIIFILCSWILYYRGIIYIIYGTKKK